jgi:Na+/melibiose symporter-like transporter
VCKHALKERAMYMTILFFALEGLTVPNFFEFIYYYAINVMKVSQLEWGVSMVATHLAGLVMILVFAWKLKEKEPKSLIKLSVIFYLISAVLNLAFIDGVYGYFNMTAQEFLIVFPFVGMAMALSHIVPMTIIAKITPSHVEATVFAFSTSIIKGSRNVGGYCFAVILNKLFFGMTATDQSNLTKAMLVAMCFRAFVLTYLWMLPTRSEVKEVQDKLEIMNEVTEDTAQLKRVRKTEF